MKDIVLTEEQKNNLDGWIGLHVKPGYGYYEITPNYIAIGLKQGILLHSGVIKGVLEITNCDCVYVQNNELIFVLNIKGASLRQTNNAQPEINIQMPGKINEPEKFFNFPECKPDRVRM